MKRLFMIHHAIKPVFDETVYQKREYVNAVRATSLEEAFQLSQNDFNDNWSTDIKPLRSTSVGDIIQDDDKFFLVCGQGFRELENT